MKKLILLAGLLAGISGPVALAQVARTPGDLTTLGGWDFNQGNLATVSSVNARYNQQYSTYFVAGTASNPGSAAFGTAYFNGSNGANFSGARSLATSNAPVYDLLSTSGLGANNSLGDQATNARSILLSSTTVLDNARAVFKISTQADLGVSGTQDFTGLSVEYSARNQGTLNGTIGWSYSLDGVNFTSFGGSASDVIAPSAAAYSVFGADFSSVTAIEGLSTVWLGLDYSEAGAGASVFIDNVAIYGTASALAAIPEPSTYAAILGALALGVVALRRRRSEVAV